MVPTRIESAGRGVALRSFPSFEDALRESAPGTKWGEEARALPPSNARGSLDGSRFAIRRSRKCTRTI
jgi:hypothetical protein